MSEDVTIRHLAAHADYAACVALQRDTWGRSFADVVPASILMVARKIGGVAAGAFARDGTLLGFVFGITGVENGRIVHWSDMLAMRPEARDLGLGRRLKEFQRREVARVGARTIYWTYDPLVARNAHLNFNVFGVRVREYARDMYGDTGSDLHRGIGTDRLVVAWDVADADLRARRDEIAAARSDAAYASSPVTGDAERPASDVASIDGSSPPPRLRIAVPADIAALQADKPDIAAAWRKSTRAAFERALANGYRVEGFTSDRAGGRSHYLLARTNR